MNKDITVTNDQIKSLEAISKYAASSNHFKNLGGEAGIFCIAMYAQELGLPIMACLFGGMKAVLGNIEISPRMMNSMIRKAGHKIEILESTDQKCTLKGTRHDTKETYTCNFTIDDARRAGLVRSGGGYEKWASDMLFARCLSRISRRLFADVISTAYIEGEIEPLDSDWERVESPPVEIKSPEMTEVDFLAKLAYNHDDPEFPKSIGEYIASMTNDRLSPQKIMLQALRNEEMTKRFVASWTNWYDAKKDSQQLTEETAK